MPEDYLLSSPVTKAMVINTQRATSPIEYQGSGLPSSLRRANFDWTARIAVRRAKNRTLEKAM